MGDYDFTKPVFAELGADMNFWKLAIRPGQPVAFGKIQGKLAFGLPGNPVSSMVTFDQLVRPAMLKMGGHRKGDLSRNILQTYRSPTFPAWHSSTGKRCPYCQDDRRSRIRHPHLHGKSEWVHLCAGRGRGTQSWGSCQRPIIIQKFLRARAL